jgi:hypothetical protein
VLRALTLTPAPRAGRRRRCCRWRRCATRRRSLRPRLSGRSARWRRRSRTRTRTRTTSARPPRPPSPRLTALRPRLRRSGARRRTRRARRAAAAAGRARRRPRPAGRPGIAAAPAPAAPRGLSPPRARWKRCAARRRAPGRACLGLVSGVIAGLVRTLRGLQERQRGRIVLQQRQTLGRFGEATRCHTPVLVVRMHIMASTRLAASAPYAAAPGAVSKV